MVRLVVRLKYNIYQDKINLTNFQLTKLYLAYDLTETQREEQKILRNHLYIARGTVTNKAYIKGNILFVNDIRYKVEDLDPTEEYVNTNVRVNSSSSTPHLLENPLTSDHKIDPV